MDHARRYKLGTLQNFRDLGGYAAEGGVTRFGVLLRSDLPWRLTEADVRGIRALGVTEVLDLRDAEESVPMRCELQDLPGIRYRGVPMKNVPKAAVRDRPGGLSAFDKEFFWGDEYIRMLEDNHPWAAECAETIADARGPLLFHCFTGKDRTGILAALVLSLCGVSEDDVAADYAVSQVYLRETYAWMRANFDDFRAAGEDCPFFSTDAANMRALTSHLRREYGGAEAFLLQCGAGRDTLDRIRERLIKKS